MSYLNGYLLIERKCLQGHVEIWCGPNEGFTTGVFIGSTKKQSGLRRPISDRTIEMCIDPNVTQSMLEKAVLWDLRAWKSCNRR